MYIIVTTKHDKKELKIKNDKTVNDDQIVIRLPNELKQKFKKALLKNDAIQSNVIRRCINEYVEKTFNKK